MMDISFFVYGLVTFSWFVGAFLTGITGIGGAMVSIPILLTVLDLRTVILSGCICGAVLSCIMGVYFLRYVDRSALPPMILGCLPGAVAGVWLLNIVPELVIQLFIGCIVLVAALWQMLDTPGRHPLSARPLWAGLSGFASGFSQTSTSVGGPPVAIYATLRRWDKDIARGTLSAYFVFCALATVSTQFFNDMYTPRVYMVSLPATLGCILGFAASIPVGRVIKQTTFRKAVLLLLVLSGVSMLLSPLLP